MTDQETALRADFCLEIDFDKSSENPSRVFRSMSEMIDAFQGIDRDLVSSIDSKIEPILLLEDVEAGSIRTWLAQQLRLIDDGALKSGEVKKVVGLYLVRAKMVIINWLEGRTKITDVAEIDGLRSELLQLAEQTDVRHIPHYVAIDNARLITGIGAVTQALSHLQSTDRASYESGEGRATFNLAFQQVPEEIEALIIKESVRTESTFIVKVKRPDFLGESQWEFRHGQGPIVAKMLDLKWLSQYHTRSVVIHPGDSLRTRMAITMNYDHDNNLISTKYEVLEVLEILPLGSSDQIVLPEI